MKYFGILAFPAKHSLSPVIHNAGFKALGIDAQYLVYEKEEHELSGFFEEVKHQPISGLSVSVPHKEAVMNFLDVIDEDAKKIGAVNTIVNKGAFLYGYNTDFSGAAKVLREECGDLTGKKVVIIGAGGTARAICYGVLKDGASVIMINRTRENAEKIKTEFKKNGILEKSDGEIEVRGFGEMVEGDVLVHTTSIWMKNKEITEEELPYFCEEEFLAGFSYVMDISYNNTLVNFPGVVETPLTLTAAEMGKKVITGEKMLLYQAFEQFKLFTGKEAPREKMESALKDALGI